MLRKCKGMYWTEYDELIRFELGYFHQWINNEKNNVIAIVELQNGKIVEVNLSYLEFLDTKEYCEHIFYISKKDNKCNHKNLENIDGFIYCKDCGQIISMHINKGE